MGVRMRERRREGHTQSDTDRHRQLDVVHDHGKVAGERLDGEAFGGVAQA